MADAYEWGEWYCQIPDGVPKLVELKFTSMGPEGVGVHVVYLDPNNALQLANAICSHANYLKSKEA